MSGRFGRRGPTLSAFRAWVRARRAPLSLVALPCHLSLACSLSQRIIRRSSDHRICLRAPQLPRQYGQGGALRATSERRVPAEDRVALDHASNVIDSNPQEALGDPPIGEDNRIRVPALLPRMETRTSLHGCVSCWQSRVSCVADNFRDITLQHGARGRRNRLALRSRGAAAAPRTSDRMSTQSSFVTGLTEFSYGLANSPHPIGVLVRVVQAG